MILLEGFDFLGITVRNLEKAQKFYMDLFDFEVAREYKTERAVILELEGTRIKLIEDASFAGNQAQNSMYMSFLMDVDDFTDALEELEKRKVPLLGDPEAEEGGERVFIQDPDGYRIKLAYRE